MLKTDTKRLEQKTWQKQKYGVRSNCYKQMNRQNSQTPARNEWSEKMLGRQTPDTNRWTDKNTSHSWMEKQNSRHTWMGQQNTRHKRMDGQTEEGGEVKLQSV